MPAVITIALFLTMPPQGSRVKSVPELTAALLAAKPGTTILIESGDYQGGILLQNLHGAPGQPITIRGEDPKNPPRFIGGGSALQLSKVSHLLISDLRIESPRHNGLNIDDGGDYGKPSHHVTLRRISVQKMPDGNNDGIKLSGLDDFSVEDCSVDRWGGSAIDMVGCHKGVIQTSAFSNGGNSGVQCKGGTSGILIQKCRFAEFGDRGVNIGGSTGLEFFRPPLKTIPAGSRFEAKNITVQGCTFVNGGAPVAFVGVDKARVRFNTIINPGRFALRILQETTLPDFVKCRKGEFSDNLVVFQSDNWGAGGVNIGPNTQPETFTFARNFWFCRDLPARSRPSPPTPETGGVYGVDPLVNADGSIKAGSPAAKVGAHALRLPSR